MKLDQFLAQLTSDGDHGFAAKGESVSKIPIDTLLGYDVRIYTKRGDGEPVKVYADREDRTVNVDVE